MKSQRKYRWTLVLLLIATTVLSAAPALVGTWDCVTTDPDGNPIHGLLAVKENAGKLAGSITIQDIVAPLVDIVSDGDTFRFKVEIKGQTYQMRVKVAGETLEGTWTDGDRKGTVKGDRKS